MLVTIIILTSLIILLIDIIGSNRTENGSKYLFKLSKKGILLLIVAVVGVAASAGKEYFEYKNQKTQNEIEHQKMLVVAMRADNAISYPIQFLAGFLTDENKKQIFQLFNTDFPDQEGKDRPDPKILDPLVILLSNHKWFSASNMERDGQKVNWLWNLGWHLMRLRDECEAFLEHYGNIKSPLVDTIDDIRIRNETLLMAIDACLKPSEYQKQFIEIYSDGIPKVHIEFYRQLFLRVLKAKRLIREIRYTDQENRITKQ